MSQLQTLEVEKLRTVDGFFPRPEPGEYVTHIDDRKALGTLIAIVGEECSVLWSRRPAPTIPDVSVSMQTQHINTNVKKLKATWGIELPRETTYEVKEEYNCLSDVELLQLQAERASYTMHIDGRVEVKRLTNQIPHDTNDPRLISRSITCRN